MQQATNVKTHSAQAQRLVVLRARGETLSTRNKIFLLVNEPSSSSLARTFGVLTWTHVILCCILFMMETVEYFTNATGGAAVWLIARVYFNVVFTIEWTLRIVGHVPLSGVLRDPVFYLDTLSVLPFWIRFFLYPDSVSTAGYLIRHGRPRWVRFLESAGTFRLLKLSRNFYGAELLVSAISRSMRELLVPSFMLFMMVIAFSAIMYDIEWDDLTYDCAELWKKEGVSRTFLLDHPDGASWGCDVCKSLGADPTCPHLPPPAAV